ncbi:MAG: hypothetical protein AB1511_11340, partial [Deinococcota bacterium]
MSGRVEGFLQAIVNTLRYVFIAFMVGYLLICMLSLGGKMLAYIPHLADPDFRALLPMLNDALFTLIVLAIVRSLFIHDSFHYALTFLEVGFVVLLRKLILVETTPEDVWLLLVLGLISALFFALILLTHHKRGTLLPKRD